MAREIKLEGSANEFAELLYIGLIDVGVGALHMWRPEIDKRMPSSSASPPYFLRQYLSLNRAHYFRSRD